MLLMETFGIAPAVGVCFINIRSVSPDFLLRD